MTFNYLGEEFELMELTEPNKNISFDMVAIFQIKGNSYIFINYFYGVDVTDKELIKQAKEYINIFYKDK